MCNHRAYFPACTGALNCRMLKPLVAEAPKDPSVLSGVCTSRLVQSIMYASLCGARWVVRYTKPHDIQFGRSLPPCKLPTFAVRYYASVDCGVCIFEED